MNDTTTNPTEQHTQKSRPRWGRILAWIALATLLTIIFLVLVKKQQDSLGPVAIGNPAPTFSLTTFDGQQITPEDMAGKVVLLNFWASWCKPCEQEAADMEAVWRDYEPRGDVLFLGIAWTDTETASLEYLDKFDITYPNGPDLGTRTSQSYRTTGVPETYVIDKNGLLQYVKLSPFISQAEIKAAIDPLLSP